MVKSLVLSSGHKKEGGALNTENTVIDNSLQYPDRSREMRNRKLLSAMPLKTWIVMWQKRDAQTGQSLLQSLQRTMPGLGMQIAPPQQVVLNDDRVETFVAGLKTNVKPGVQMVICLLPNNAKNRYDAIKKLCCVEQPVPS